MGQQNIETGCICQKSGWYRCSKHPVIDEYVKEGDFFPRCRQAAGHETKWIEL